MRWLVLLPDVVCPNSIITSLCDGVDEVMEDDSDSGVANCRLFKRIASLRMIIEGVLASLPGVMNAFIVLAILISIWSIMGVTFFIDDTNHNFDSFGAGCFSMWQVMTMDSWSSAIARPIIFDQGSYVGAPFFISFTFIAGIVMMNVVVAILLDKYLEVCEH